MCNSCSLTLSNPDYSVRKLKKMTVHTFQTCSRAQWIKYKTNEKQTERMEGIMAV